MASKRAIRRKACDGKVRHKDKKSAMYAIFCMVKDIGKLSGFIAPYKCKFCKQYHVGHPPRGRKVTQ